MLPVLNQNQGPIAEAVAKRAELAARFNALQTTVLSDIDQAVAGYHAALQKQEDAVALMATLQQQEQRSRAMFDLGEISENELVAQQLQLSTSALARLDATIKSQQAMAALEDALQRPLPISPPVWENNPRATEPTKK